MFFSLLKVALLSCLSFVGGVNSSVESNNTNDKEVVEYKNFDSDYFQSCFIKYNKNNVYNSNSNEYTIMTLDLAYFNSCLARYFTLIQPIANEDTYCNFVIGGDFLDDYSGGAVITENLHRDYIVFTVDFNDYTCKYFDLQRLKLNETYDSYYFSTDSNYYTRLVDNYAYDSNKWLTHTFYMKGLPYYVNPLIDYEIDDYNWYFDYETYGEKYVFSYYLSPYYSTYGIYTMGVNGYNFDASEFYTYLNAGSVYFEFDMSSLNIYAPLNGYAPSITYGSNEDFAYYNNYFYQSSGTASETSITYDLPLFRPYGSHSVFNRIVFHYYPATGVLCPSFSVWDDTNNQYTPQTKTGTSSQLYLDYIYFQYYDTDSDSVLISNAGFKCVIGDWLGISSVYLGTVSAQTFDNGYHNYWGVQTSYTTDKLYIYTNNVSGVLSTMNSIGFIAGDGIVNTIIVNTESSTTTAFANSFSLINYGLSAITGFLSIEIFPYISIGVLCLIPLAITLLLFVARLFKR